MRLPLATGVGMLAAGSMVLLKRQRNLPVFASTPTTPLPRNCTYSLPPPTSAITTEAYAAASPPGTGDFQITAPVFLFRATSVAVSPPGVQTSTSPSTSGDSEYAHM